MSMEININPDQFVLDYYADIVTMLGENPQEEDGVTFTNLPFGMGIMGLRTDVLARVTEAMDDESKVLGLAQDVTTLCQTPLEGRWQDISCGLDGMVMQMNWVIE